MGRKDEVRQKHNAPNAPPMVNDRYVFCPEQEGFVGPRAIPIIEYRYRGGTRAFRKLMAKRWRRARKIASVLIGQNQIPLAPLQNPRTKRPSCHIIKLIDHEKPLCSVDLLFLDTNAYVAAFRRQHRDEDGSWSGNKWFRYSDMKNLPPEIAKDAVSLGFDSSHADGSYTTPGGFCVLNDMFNVLSSCEDYERDRKTGKLLKKHDIERVKGALLKVIVIFSEAFRFRCIYLLMLQRSKDGNESSQLDGETWVLIHNWDHACTELLRLWKSDLPPMHTAAPEWFLNIKVTRPGSTDPVSLSTLEHIIGPNGELMFLNGHAEDVVPDGDQLEQMTKRLKKNTCLPIPEPGFD